MSELADKYPNLQLKLFLAETGLEKVPDLIMGQPEFFAGLDKLVKERPLDDWKTYLRWENRMSSWSREVRAGLFFVMANASHRIRRVSHRRYLSLEPALCVSLTSSTLIS